MEGDSSEEEPEDKSIGNRPSIVEIERIGPQLLRLRSHSRTLDYEIDENYEKKNDEIKRLARFVQTHFGSGSERFEEQKGGWRRAYQTILQRHGYVRVKIIRCVFIGPSGVGKSTLKRLLIDNKSTVVNISTGIMEAPEVVMVTSLPDKVPSQSKGEEAIDECYFYDEDQWVLSTDSLLEKIIRTVAKRSNFQCKQFYFPLQRDATPLPTSAESHDLSHETDLSKLLDDLLQNEEETDKVDLGKATLVHFLDTGGQPAFHDALPFLFTLPCTYLLTFNASNDISKQADITYRPTENQCLRIDNGPSTLNMILKSLSSVHVASLKPINAKLSSIVESHPHLNILLVGTHKDVLMKSEERSAILQSHRESLSVLKLKPYYKHLILNDPASSRKITEENRILLINSMMKLSGKPNQGDSDTLKYLKRKILESPKNALELDMPLMWFLLDVIIRRSKDKFFPYNHLKAFCTEGGFVDKEDTDSQFQAMLELFTMLGMYAYFAPKEESSTDNWICTDVTVLLGEIGKLLSVCFYEPEAAIVEEFQESGIVGEDFNLLFKELGIDIPEACHKWLLHLLHHLGLAAQVHPKEYFMPVVLPYGKVEVPRFAVVSNLCFAFSLKQESKSLAAPRFLDLPNGIFCRLVVALTDCQESQLSLQPNLTAKNCDRTTIRLSWNERQEFDIYLMEKPGHIEVALFCSKHFYLGDAATRLAELHNCCSRIRSAAFESLTAVSTDMVGDELVPNMGFNCSCTPDKPHLALNPTSDADVLMCTFDERQSYSPSMKIWFLPVKISNVEFKIEDKSYLVLQDGDTSNPGLPDQQVTTTACQRPIIQPQPGPAESDNRKLDFHSKSVKKGASEIQMFLYQSNFHSQLVENADVQSIASYLCPSGVIKADQLVKFGNHVGRQEANANLFEILANDPSERKLRRFSSALKKETTHENNQELAELIDRFLGDS